MINRYYTVSIKTVGGILAMYRCTKRETAEKVKKGMGISASVTQLITTQPLPLGDLLKVGEVA